MNPTKKLILLSAIGGIILAGYLVLLIYQPSPPPIRVNATGGEAKIAGEEVPSIIIGLILAFIFGALAILPSLIELVVLRRLGFDIAANLNIKGEFGKSEVQFQAVGVIAFLVFQPLLLFYIGVEIAKLLSLTFDK